MSLEEAHEGEESSSVSSSKSEAKKSTEAIIHLLDEHWFFYNTLDSHTKAFKLAVEDQSSNAKTKALGMQLRMVPSLPAGETAQEDTSRSSSYLGSTLQAYQTHSSPSLCKSTRLDTNMMRQKRPPRDTKPEGTKNSCMNRQYSKARESKWRKAFRQKKWKSLSDLEHEEVQGFKDLGFVFDEAELSASLVQVIPGLRSSDQPTTEDVAAQRPYLSEAWLVQRSSPLMMRWDDRRSPADMKQQLKFWARAVACYMHEDC